MKFILKSILIRVTVFKQVFGFRHTGGNQFISRVEQDYLCLCKRFNIISFSNNYKLHLSPFPVYGLAFTIISQVVFSKLFFNRQICFESVVKFWYLILFRVISYHTRIYLYISIIIIAIVTFLLQSYPLPHQN